MDHTVCFPVMHPTPLRLGFIIAALLLGACQKNAEGPSGATPPKSEAAKSQAVGVVKESERSRHFAAVNKHLELGGILYGYADVDATCSRWPVK